MEKPRKAAPSADAHTSLASGDFYRIADVLDSHERSIVDRLRLFMESDVAPIINDYWAKAKFPFELVPKLRELGHCRDALRRLRLPRQKVAIEGSTRAISMQMKPFSTLLPMAAGDGPPGQDRRLRLDGAGCGIGRCWRIDDDRAARGRPLAPEGIVTLPCEERERTTPQRFSSGRDDLVPRTHRRGA